MSCTCSLLGNPLQPMLQCPRHPDPSRCKGCGKFLRPENETIADGCPCNTPRGVNHGIVKPEVCTCEVCDPAKTGSSRVRT